MGCEDKVFGFLEVCEVCHACETCTVTHLESSCMPCVNLKAIRAHVSELGVN
jgi:hypothetical protein